MDFIKKNIKIIGIVGCVLMLLGNFLPFMTAEASVLGYSDSESMSLMSGDVVGLGILFIIIEIVMLLLVLKNKKKLSIIPNTLVLILLLVCYSILGNYTGDADYGIGSASISFGIGFYAIILGIILGYVFAFIKGDTENETPKA